ncbi:TonB-dependent receptor plug domain-containing protein [Hyphobacterium sp.]|uniref:TonB-dependent receptor plug domain-containing protein n=1 Tax=Hyphobacterium sp. TaxID=2004662 RepID=UPI003747F9B3
MCLKSSLRRSCAAIFLFSSSAFAQTGIIEPETSDTIIVIGGRIPALAEDITSATSIVDEDDIALRGGLTLADTLRSVPGIAMSRSGGTGGLTDLRLRGSEANHVLVLIDGIEASVPLTGGYDFAHAPGFGVERVEVLRGEQSALWGSDAIGGVINIRTAGSTGQDGRSAQIETGSFGTVFAGANISGERGRLRGGASISWLQTDGIDVSDLGGEKDAYQRFFASTTGDLNLGEGESIQWTARVADFESEFDSDSDFNGLLDNTNQFSVGQQMALGARLTLQRFGLRHDLAVNVSQDDLANYSNAAFQSESRARRWQAFYQPTMNWQTGGIAHQLTGLVEFERDTFDSFSGAGAGSNQSQETENSAAAFDYRLSSGPARLSASVRQDWNDRFEDAATWRVGGAWQFDTIGGRVRASFGDGVKNPGIYELFGFFPGFFAGNPDLTPERSRGWEIGWDQTFADMARVSLTWFEAELEDEIFTDFSASPSTARNRATRSHRSGIEIDGDARLTDRISISGSATFQQSDENGAPEIRRPEFTGSVAINWQSADERWQAGLAADHTGDQLDTDFGTFTNVTLPAYTLLSARLAWQASPALQVYLRGTNLSEEEGRDVFGYESEGRGLFLGLRLGH